MSVIGTWAPLPGRIVDIAATKDTLFLADVPEAGHPIRVHAGRWRAGRWRWTTPWIVAWPPALDPNHELTGTSASLSVDAGPGSIVHVTLNRIEYQGGSHGLALATFIDGTWTAHEAIESPTDSDIAFGTPALRRGASLLTCEPDDRLWHYTRERTRWKGRPLALPDGATGLSGPMDLDANGSELVVGVHDANGKPSLALYRQGSTGSYTLATTRTLPGSINALAFAGSELYVGFQRPTPDGAIVWALGPDLVPARRYEFPAPDDPRWEHLSDLDASADWILVLQLDAAWVRDSAGLGPLRRLELPSASDSKCRWPTGVLMGSVAVVIVEDRLGTFELA